MPTVPSFITKPVAGALDLLSRPGQAGVALGARHNLGAAWNALVHGDAPGQYASDIGTLEGRFNSRVPFAKHIPQPIEDFVMQTVFDPTTYLGGSGLIRKGSVALGEHALPVGMRLASKAAKSIVSRAPAAAPAVEMLERAATDTHNFFTPGGKPVANMFRTRAAKQGAEGVRNAQRVVAARSAASAFSSHLEATLRDMYDHAMHGLTPLEQSRINRAVHFGRIAKLPPELASRAKEIETMTRSMAYLRGSKALQKKLASLGFQLPDRLQVFASAVPRSVQKASQFKESYLPLAHNLEPEEAAALAKKIATKRGGFDVASVQDPRLLRRLSEPAQILNDPDLYREAMYGAIRGSARTTAAADLRKLLTSNFAPQEMRTYFKANPFREAAAPEDLSPEAAQTRLESIRARNLPSPAARKAAGPLVEIGGRAARVGPGGYSADIARAGVKFSRLPSSYRAMQRYMAVPADIRGALKDESRVVKPGVGELFDQAQNLGDLGKATLFTTPFAHMRNIGTLLAVADPLAVPDALRTYGKMGAGLFGRSAAPEAQFRAIADAARAGASGSRNVEQSGLVRALAKGGKIGKAASRYYAGVGKSLWAFDDAAKAALFRRNLQFFKDPLVAAYHTQKQMVDYGLLSPFQRAARVVAPFASWRTAMPGALAKSVAEHPERLLALNRATGGAFGGQPFQAGGSQRQFVSPVSEGSALLDVPKGAAKYGRGALSLTAREALDALLHGIGVKGKQANWATYGISPGTYALKNLPFVGQGMSLAGHGLFDTPATDELLYLLTGIETKH